MGKRPRRGAPPWKKALGMPLISITGRGVQRDKDRTHPSWWQCKCPAFGDPIAQCPLHGDKETKEERPC